MANGNTSFARTEHGVPFVANAAARDALFPNPSPDQRVERKDTGFRERYDQVKATWLPVGVTGEAGPLIRVKSKGAKGDSSDGVARTDDYQAIVDSVAAAAGAGIVVFDPGVYYVSLATDLSSARVEFALGAQIMPASAKQVTLGRILAGSYQILNYSLAGTFLLASGANQADEFNIRWTGTKGDGTDDTLPYNRAIDLCYGVLGPTTRNGLANAKKNRPLYMPPGTYNVDYIDFSGTVGFTLRGGGRLVTTLNVQHATSVGIYGDMAAYGEFQDFIITCSVARDEAHPVVDIDGKAIQGGGIYPSGTGSFLFPQQWVFANVYFNANGLAQVMFNWCRIGGSNAQGDTVEFRSCFGGVAQLACFMFGSRTVVCGNGLDIHFYGGDIQTNPVYGIYSNGATVYVHGTGFQNQGNTPYITSGGLPTNNAGASEIALYNQIDAIDPVTLVARRGCDVFMHQYSTYGMIENLRSESMVLCRDTGIREARNIDLRAGVIENWGLDNNYYKLGHLVWFDPSLNTPALCDGRAYMMVRTGTSGASQPDTTAIARGFVTENATVVAANATISFPNVPQGIPGDGSWWCVIVGGRSVGGTLTKSYHQITGSVGGVSITVSPAPTVSITPSGSSGGIVRIGQAFSEPGAIGTPRLWMPYDYVAIEGDAIKIDGNEVALGQMNAINTPVSEITNRTWFSRTDYRYNFSGQFNGSFVGGTDAGRTGNGSATNKQPERPKSLNPMSTTPKDIGRRAFTGPLEFIHGSGTVAYASVIFGLYDGTFNTVPTSISARSHTVFALKQGSFGAAPAVGADQPGRKIDIVGGLPTGAGVPGGIGFIVGVAGGSGSGVNDGVECAQFDSLGRLQLERGRILNKVPQAIAAAGNFTPDPSQVEWYVITAAGNITLNNPPAAAKVAGARYKETIFNNTGGAITVTRGADYLGTYTPPATAKRNSIWWAYDDVLAKWTIDSPQTADV